MAHSFPVAAPQQSVYSIGETLSSELQFAISTYLRDFGFGVILNEEQIDVRHVLLADSPFAPAPGACTPLQAKNIN